MITQIEGQKGAIVLEKSNKIQLKNLHIPRSFFKKSILCLIALPYLYGCGVNTLNEKIPENIIGDKKIESTTPNNNIESKKILEDLIKYGQIEPQTGDKYLLGQEEVDSAVKLLMEDPLLANLGDVGNIIGNNDVNKIVYITRNLNLRNLDINEINISAIKTLVEKIRKELEQMAIFKDRTILKSFYVGLDEKLFPDIYPSMFFNEAIVKAINDNNPTKTTELIGANSKIILDSIGNAPNAFTFFSSGHGIKKGLYYASHVGSKSYEFDPDKTVDATKLFEAYQTSIINRMHTDFLEPSNKDIFVISACDSTNFALAFLKLCDDNKIPKPIVICAVEFNQDTLNWHKITVNTNILMNYLFGIKNIITIGQVIEKDDNEKYHGVTIWLGDKDNVTIQISKRINELISFALAAGRVIHINLKTPLPIYRFA